MWIYSKKNKVLTECSNADVIKICKKDSDTFIVEQSLDEIKELINVEIKSEKSSNETKKELKDLAINDLKKLAEEQGIENFENLTKVELIKVLSE